MERVCRNFRIKFSVGRIPEWHAYFGYGRRHAESGQYPALRSRRGPPKTGENTGAFGSILPARRTGMYERHTFYQRQQEDNEPVESFITDLRTLARTCDFTEGGKDFTEQMIRDRLVCGIADDAVRHRLLAKDKPSLATCIKECRSAATTRIQFRKISQQGKGTKEQACGGPGDLLLRTTMFHPRKQDQQSAACRFYKR